jgi:hypothetical protein
MLNYKNILYDLLKGEIYMNYEKMKELEKIINSDYRNITGITVPKTA